MQSWEIKNHWIPVDIKKTISQNSAITKSVTIAPTWGDEFKKAWAEAEVLANDGWELVSVAPETCAHVVVGDTSDRSVMGGYSYTAGYMLVFRRPKP